MPSRTKFVKPMGTIFATMCIAALAMPLCAEQVVPGDYAKTFNITFPSYRGTTTLTDFPVLIRLSAALNDFKYSACKVLNGGDLRFADADGNLLASEIDTWDENGTSLVWVKVPSFNKNTVIKAYYGNANPPAVAASDVWANGYVAVWHLNESALPMKESSGVSKDFTSAGYDQQNIADLGLASEGVVGRSVNFRGDEGKKCALAAPDDDNLDGFSSATFEFWTNQTMHDNTTDRFLMVKRVAYNSDNTYTFYDHKSKSKTAIAYSTVMGDGVNADFSLAYPDGCIPELNRWNYQVATYSVASAFASNYLNGVAKNGFNLASGSYSAKLGAIRNSTGTLKLGNAGTDSSYAFPGRIDEVRISNVARSKDWIEASYDMVVSSGFAVCFDSNGNDWSKYSRKFTISFTGYAGETTLVDFPVLVKISEAGISGFHYADCLKANGGDLRFADADGNILASEVDTWDENGESLVWVKVPSLNASTKITAYYGWNLASPVDPAAVWAKDFVGVWHLDEDSLVQYDSTTNGINFVSPDGSYYITNITIGVSGVTGAAIDFSKGKLGCFIAEDDRGILDGYDAMTLEVWTWQDHHDPAETPWAGYFLSKYRNVSGASDNGWVYVMNESANNGKTSFAVKRDSGGTFSEDWFTISDSHPKPARATWNYHVGRFDGANAKGAQFLNGVLACDKTIAVGTVRSTVGNLHLGNQFKSWSSSFPGKLDEVRVSNVARSADWVKATYDTIANNSTFMTYGDARDQVKGFLIIVR